MSFMERSLVAETTLSTGAGDLTLAGAIEGFFAIGAKHGDGDPVNFLVFDEFGNKQIARYVYHSSGDYLSLDEVFVSTEADDAAVTWTSAGTGIKTIKEVSVGLGDLDSTGLASLRDLLGVTALLATKPTAALDTDGALAANSDANVASQKATKTYVDNGIAAAALNLSRRATVRVATTANVTISTALATGAAIDGVTLSSGDRVLVKDQSTASQNGVYVAGAVPARATDFDTYDEHPGSMLVVEEGTTYADTLWFCTSNLGGTLGTTAIVFSRLGPYQLIDANLTSLLASIAAGTPSLTEIGHLDGVSSAIQTQLNNKAAAGANTDITSLAGTSTNNDAAAGKIGEYTENNLGGGSPTSLVTGTPKNITTLSLTAGDWDVSGNLGFNCTSVTDLIACFSTASNTLGSSATNGYIKWAPANDGVKQFGLGPMRYSLASTTTIYLVGRAVFTGSASAYGLIRARRMR